MIYSIYGFWEIHEDGTYMFTFAECFSICLAYTLSNIVCYSFYESQIPWLVVC